MRLTYGAVTFTAYDDDGFLGIQCDVYGETQSGMPAFEAVGQYGFFSRPSDPTETGASGVLYYRWGDQVFALPLGDPRRTGTLPPMPKGSSVQYCAQPSIDMHSGDDGTKTVYVEYPDGSTSHLLTIGFDADEEPIIEMTHGDGQGLTLFKGKSILKNKAGTVYLELNDDGTVQNGDLKVNGSLECNGARIDPTGDVITKTGVSLTFLVVPTAMGPSGNPIPTATPG